MSHSLASPLVTSEAQAGILGWLAEMNPSNPRSKTDPQATCKHPNEGAQTPLPWILCILSTSVSMPGSPLPHSTHARSHCGQRLLLASCLPGATWIRGKKGWMLNCCGRSQSQGTIPTRFYSLNCGSPWTFLMKILTDLFTGSWKSRGTERNKLLSSCLSLTSIFRWSSCHFVVALPTTKKSIQILVSEKM